MPVTRISASVDWSMNSGAARWMGMVSLVLTGPRSSTGSPTTLRMRPSVSGPTGTRMGEPVSTASMPRTSPSVVSMATARTVFSPRCCATSSTRVLPWFFTCSALRIDGRSASNLTSTTAPMICEMEPTLFLAMVGLPLERLGARNDLDQFLGDVGLTLAVVGHVQPVDHLAGVARGVVHRRHARALFGSRVLQERGEDLYAQMARQQRGQDFLFLGLEFINPDLGGIGLVLALGNGEGDQLLPCDDLADGRFEAVEDDAAGVELAGLEAGDQKRRDVLGGGEGQFRPAHLGQAFDDLLGAVALHGVAPLAAYGEDLHLLAGAFQLADLA